MNAKEILLKAVRCDQQGRILEAQSHYQEGIQILMDMVSVEKDPEKKRVFFDRIQEYIERAEQIKERIRQHTTEGELITNLPIEDGSTGHSYRTIFGKYLHNDLREVLIEEPYLMEKYHFQNLIIFLELLVKSSKNLKYIRLVTKPDAKHPETQLSILEKIKADMQQYGITLSIIFEDTLHDRKIVFGNGIIVKIGRGLHYFKAPNPILSLGMCDYDFRKCLQTDVDIWRTKKFS